MKPVLDIYQKTEIFEIKNAIIESILKQAESFSRVIDKNNATIFYEQAVALGKESDAVVNSAICLSGSIYGFTEIVLPAGKRAVESNPDSPFFHDSYGLALALVGKYEEAANELEFYEKWLKSDYTKEHVIDQSKKYFEARRKWIQDLKKKDNPFNKYLLERFKNKQSQIQSIQERGSVVLS